MNTSKGNRNIKRALFLIPVFGLAMILMLAYLVYTKLHYMTDVTLSEEIVLTQEWTDIDSRNLLSPIFQENNIVYLAVPSPYETMDVKRGIIGPDGIVIEPQIEAIDSEGITYRFRRTRGRRTSHQLVGYESFTEIRKGARIEKIRIKSDHEIRISYVLWSSYDTKDLP